jgi:hypothetical protein
VRHHVGVGQARRQLDRDRPRGAVTRLGDRPGLLGHDVSQLVRGQVALSVGGRQDASDRPCHGTGVTPARRQPPARVVETR